MLVWAFAPFLARKLMILPKFIRHAVAVIIVCAVLYTPFSMIYFNGLCIYSFIVPLIVAPLIVCVLITGPLTLLLMEAFGGAPIFSWLTNIVISVFYKLPYFIWKLPLSHINVRTPTIIEIIAYLSGVFLLYYIIRKHKNHIKLCGNYELACDCRHFFEGIFSFVIKSFISRCKGFVTIW